MKPTHKQAHANARFRLRLRLAPKAYPSARVTDNRAQFQIRHSDTLTGRTPLWLPPARLLATRRARLLATRRARLLATRRALIMDALITWGAVVAVLVWILSR